MTAIDVIVPMLGRPEAVQALSDTVFGSSEEGYDLRLTFVASESDEEVVEALHRSMEDFIVIPGEPEPGDYARKINVAFDALEAPWMLLGASDIKLHRGWASAAIELGQEYDAGVVGTNDMGNPTVTKGLHSTHPVVSRAYVDQCGGGWDGPGVVLHEGYSHQWCDTELVTAAQARGRWVFCHEAKIEHLHPFWNKGTMDDTYRRGLAGGAQDARLFQSRSRRLGGRR